MITRVVRMTFHDRHISSFLELFQARQEQIRAREGCTYLSLYRQSRFPNVFFTISHWTDKEALQSYRESKLFRETWKKTKSWFADRPMAWSLQEVTVLE